MYCIVLGLLLLLGRTLAEHVVPLGGSGVLAALDEAGNADRVANLVGRANGLAHRGVGRIRALLVRNGARLGEMKRDFRAGVHEGDAPCPWG